MAPTVKACDLDDYRWLVSGVAGPWLDRAAHGDRATPNLVRDLRKDLSAARAHLVIEQAELRQRAARSGRFPAAERMFFAPTLLEQATSCVVARYKARRFPPGQRVADLCCGLGGDLIALAERCSVVGVDLDATAALLARANCLALAQVNAEVVVADATRFPVRDFAAWHLDPDRRPRGRRTTRPELHQPALDAIEQLRHTAPNASVKLAPAADVPDAWSTEGELEWIGEGRGCKQLVAWFGNLARHPGRRAATVLKGEGSAPATVIGVPDTRVSFAAEVGRYVYEPHAAVLAARLAGSLAVEHDLARLSLDQGYLTGDRLVADDLLAAFEVIDTLPLDMKQLKAALRGQRAGTLEVKKRGLDIHPETVRRRLSVPGNEHRVLLATRFQGRATAIIARRVSYAGGIFMCPAAAEKSS